MQILSFLFFCIYLFNTYAQMKSQKSELMQKKSKLTLKVIRHYVKHERQTVEIKARHD